MVAGDIPLPDLAGETAILRAALDHAARALGTKTWKAWTSAITAATGAQGKALYHPLRLALTGEDRARKWRRCCRCWA